MEIMKVRFEQLQNQCLLGQQFRVLLTECAERSRHFNSEVAFSVTVDFDNGAVNYSKPFVGDQLSVSDPTYRQAGDYRWLVDPSVGSLPSPRNDYITIHQ